MSRMAKLLYARGGDLEKAYRFKPFVSDWNGDGKPDLLFGACLPGGERTLHGHVWVCLRK